MTSPCGFSKKYFFFFKGLLDFRKTKNSPKDKKYFFFKGPIGPKNIFLKD